MTFWEKLAALRKLKGFSERKLAEMAGFDQSAISQARKRGSVPREELTKRIADTLGVSVELLTNDALDLPMQHVAARDREAALNEIGDRVTRKVVSDYIRKHPEQIAAIGENLRRLLEPLAKQIEEMRATIDRMDENFAALLAEAIESEVTKSPGEHARDIREAMKDLPPTPLDHPSETTRRKAQG